MNNTILYGCAVVKGIYYHDNDLIQLVDQKVGAYGRGWKYGGDQLWEECNFVLILLDQDISYTYSGRKGLPMLLEHYRQAKEAGYVSLSVV